MGMWKLYRAWHFVKTDMGSIFIGNFETGKKFYLRRNKNGKWNDYIWVNRWLDNITGQGTVLNKWDLRYWLFRKPYFKEIGYKE